MSESRMPSPRILVHRLPSQLQEKAPGPLASTYSFFSHPTPVSALQSLLLLLHPDPKACFPSSSINPILKKENLLQAVFQGLSTTRSPVPERLGSTCTFPYDNLGDDSMYEPLPSHP